MTFILVPMIAFTLLASIWDADLKTLASPTASPTPGQSAEALVGACRKAFNGNDLKRALDDCNKAIALDSTSASAYALRGDVKDLRGDPHGEGELPGFSFSPSLGSDRSAALLITGPLPGTSSGDLTLIQPSGADGELNGLVTVAGGRLDLDLNHYDAAVGHFTTAIKNDPTRGSAFSGRCEAYVDLSKYALAIDDCQKALDIDPDNDDGLFYIATAEHNAGRTTESVGHWTTYIKKHPNDSNPYYNRGLALIDANELQAALKDFSTYIERKPRDGDGFYKRAIVENKLGDRAAALADLKTAVRLYQIAGDDGGAKRANALIDQIGGN